jgi:ribonucleoside-diphosphate reductase beta chain
VTYNMIIEGVLAETGYYTYHRMLGKRHLLPGLQQLTGLVKRDESRHIAFGVYFLSRLIAEHGAEAWTTFEHYMKELLPLALELYSNSAALTVTFGIEKAEVIAYAMAQFQKRYDRIARSRGRSVAHVDVIAKSIGGSRGPQPKSQKSRAESGFVTLDGSPLPACEGPFTDLGVRARILPA